MTKQTIDLRSISLSPLNGFEARTIQGGSFLGDWIKGHIVDFAVEMSVHGLWHLSKASADHEARVRATAPGRVLPGL